MGDKIKTNMQTLTTPLYILSKLHWDGNSLVTYTYLLTNHPGQNPEL
jgi:hypothetical protein